MYYGHMRRTFGRSRGRWYTQPMKKTCVQNQLLLQFLQHSALSDHIILTKINVTLVCTSVLSSSWEENEFDNIFLSSLKPIRSTDQSPMSIYKSHQSVLLASLGRQLRCECKKCWIWITYFYMNELKFGNGVRWLFLVMNMILTLPRRK